MSVFVTATIRQIAGSPLVSGLAAYAASEVLVKISRLGVVVVLARFLAPAEIGIAAGAIAISEILKSLTENGVGQRIIAAQADELDSVCVTAHRIFWVWCLGLAAVQISVASALWYFGGTETGFLLIATLALEYLVMPAGLVQCALAMREGKLKQTAAISGGQNLLANGLTAIMVMVWPAPLSVTLPRFLAAPVWLVGMRRLRPWGANPHAQPAPLASFVKFGSLVLGVEFIKALRMQIDKLIIGALLGPAALGVYFFAFNAGFGIATSLSTAFSTVLFPHLCTSENRERALGSAFLVALGVLAPIVVVQSMMAPIYVPLAFGSEWLEAAPIVSILCLAAIPGIIWSVSAQWLRATGRANHELAFTAGGTIILAAVTIVTARFGLMAVAWGVLAAATVSQLAVSIPAIRVAIGARIAVSQPAKLRSA